MWNSWYLIKDPPSLLKGQQADVIAKPCRFLYAFRITLQWLYISLLSTISGVIFIFFVILLLFLVFFFRMPVFFSARTIWAFPPLFAFFFFKFMKSYKYRHLLTMDSIGDRCQQLFFFLHFRHYWLVDPSCVFILWLDLLLFLKPVPSFYWVNLTKEHLQVTFKINL